MEERIAELLYDAYNEATVPRIRWIGPVRESVAFRDLDDIEREGWIAVVKRARELIAAG